MYEGMAGMPCPHIVRANEKFSAEKVCLYYKIMYLYIVKEKSAWPMYFVRTQTRINLKPLLLT